mgnify:CR=1 FL=1
MSQQIMHQTRWGLAAIVVTFCLLSVVHSVVIPLFEARHPALSLSVLESEDGGQLLVAINHGDASLEELSLIHI